MVSSNINYAAIFNVFPGAKKQRGLRYSPDVHVPVPSRKLSITLKVSEFENVPPNNATFSMFDYTSFDYTMPIRPSQVLCIFSKFYMFGIRTLSGRSFHSE